MNSKVKQHLADKWWLYLAVALILILVWEWIFEFVDELKPNEKVTITASSYYFDGSIADKLQESCPKPSYLRAIEINGYGVLGNGSYDDYTLQSQLQVMVFEEQSDLMILPKNVIDQMKSFVLSYCAELSQQYIEDNFGQSLTDKFGGVQVLQVEGNEKLWGIKLYDGATGVGFACDYLTYVNGDNTQDYYLLFAVNSVHTSSLNGETSVDDYAIDLAKALLQL